MLPNALKLACLTWLIGMGTSEALWIPYRHSEELESQATLICNGTVVSTETGSKEKFTYPNISPSSRREFVMLAKIKVLHVFKGKAPAEVTFSYRAPIDIESGGVPYNWLEKGPRYRFFLKPGPVRGQYVGVLNGESVEKLWPNEPDDSPFLLKEDAIKIARDYTASKKLELKVVLSHAEVYCDCGGWEPEGSTWTVMYFDPAANPPGLFWVVIRGDRTVDPARTRLEGNPSINP